MINAMDFIEFLGRAPQNRQLLAKIALNSLGHERSARVDISELDELYGENFAMVMGFLTWRALHPSWALRDAAAESLRAIANGSTAEGSLRA
jgi:hypothetical protein